MSDIQYILDFGVVLLMYSGSSAGGDRVKISRADQNIRLF